MGLGGRLPVQGVVSPPSEVFQIDPQHIGEELGRLGAATAPARLDLVEVVARQARPSGELLLAEPLAQPPVLEGGKWQASTPEGRCRLTNRAIPTRNFLGIISHASNLLPCRGPSISPYGKPLNEPLAHGETVHANFRKSAWASFLELCTSGLPDEDWFARAVSKNSPSETRPSHPRLSSRYPGISGAPEPSNAGTKTTTGVPDKNYRGAQQGSPSASRPLTPPRRLNKPKARPIRPRETPMATYRGPLQGLPGCPTKTTGVPDKNYRGARQKLPGCPTKTTGVPDNRHFLKLLQNGVFRVVFFGSFVFVSLVVLCC